MDKYFLIYLKPCKEYRHCDDYKNNIKKLGNIVLAKDTWNECFEILRKTKNVIFDISWKTKKEDHIILNSENVDNIFKSANEKIGYKLWTEEDKKYLKENMDKNI